MSEIKKLYSSDFNLWVEQTKLKIQNRDFEDMDWDNLLEEIDDMGKSEKRSLESYLEQLVAHLLKLTYWESEKERNYRHWKVEVINFRSRITRVLKRNPSFNNYMQEIYPDIFQDVVKSWRVEFEIPPNCELDLETILKDDYFP